MRVPPMLLLVASVVLGAAWAERAAPTAPPGRFDAAAAGLTQSVDEGVGDARAHLTSPAAEPKVAPRSRQTTPAVADAALTAILGLVLAYGVSGAARAPGRRLAVRMCPSRAPPTLRFS